MRKENFGIILGTILLASACNSADFGGNGSDKDKGQVIPATGQKNEPNGPLDLSEMEKNFPIKDSGGPIGSIGEENSQIIELDCDDSQGIVIDISGPGGDQPPPVDTPPGDNPPGDNPPGVEPNPFDPDSPLYELVGTPNPVDLDTDGKVIGGKPGSGKPNGKPKPPVVVPKPGKVVTTVKGKFCPESKNALTVLFVVDYSGSMGRHVPESGGAEVPGHDPQTNGTCGRLQAADAIVSKIMAEKSPSDEVYIGMVPFAGGVVNNRIIQITEIEEFANQISKDTFCQYVVQSPDFGYDPVNPGGIEGPSGLLGFGRVDASTNYRAAFTAAESMLSHVYGRKEVYFISDGEPTSGGVDPTQAGIDAGASLRANVDNLQLNALLLGHTKPNARQVLEGVAGSPDRVRDAADADQLAEKILEFPNATIDESTGDATLTVNPYPTENLGLQFLGPDPGQANVWLYETQPFVLLGIPGQTVVNRVDVTALGSDGSTHAAAITINYKMD